MATKAEIIAAAAALGTEPDTTHAESVARFIVESEYVAASGKMLPLANGMGLDPDPNNIVVNDVTAADRESSASIADWVEALKGAGDDPAPFLDAQRAWLYETGRYAKYITRPAGI